MALAFMLISASRKFSLVLVTAPDRKTARKLAAAAVKARLAACANVVPQLESIYWWKRKLEKSKECLILFKTRASLVSRLEHLILKEHPFDTPEFISLNLDRGNRRYLRWCKLSVS